MSLSWRDDLRVGLFPDRLVITRVPRGLAKRATQKEIVPLAPGPADAPRWQGAVDALGKLSGDTFKNADVTVVLSNFFVRYTVVPWSATLSGLEERLVFARHCFTETYGAVAEGWVIRASPSSAGKPQLACAVERELIEAVNQAMAATGARFTSLQPQLMASFNLYRKRFGDRPAWFVALEPGLACLALVQGGHWQSMRTTQIGSEWPRELPVLLSREACLVEGAPDCNEVLVSAPDAPYAQLPDTGAWRIQDLAAQTV